MRKVKVKFMMHKKWLHYFVSMLLAGALAACSSTPQPATPTLNPPTATQIAATQTPSPQATVTVNKLILPTALATQHALEALVQSLYASDPSLEGYDPNSAAYAAFPQTIQQIVDLGSNGIVGDDALAIAITYPRADAYLAAQALLSLGPAATTTTLPTLIDDLKSTQAETRAEALILMGSVGKDASCGVGQMGPLLWDEDAGVRTAAALGIERITAQSFVPTADEITLTPAFRVADLKPDSPAGHVTGKARTWWNTQGTQTVWHPGYDLCDP